MSRLMRGTLITVAVTAVAAGAVAAQAPHGWPWFFLEAAGSALAGFVAMSGRPR